MEILIDTIAGRKPVSSIYGDCGLWIHLNISGGGYAVTDAVVGKNIWRTLPTVDAAKEAISELLECCPEFPNLLAACRKGGRFPGYARDLILDIESDVWTKHRTAIGLRKFTVKCTVYEYIEVETKDPYEAEKIAMKESGCDEAECC